MGKAIVFSNCSYIGSSKNVHKWTW